jgi:hypothetical protein
MKNINILFKLFKHNIENVKEIIQKIINNIDENIKITEYLGSGVMGYAFSTNLNTIIKITTDDFEAINSQYLINNKLKNFAKYYWVYKINILDYIETDDNEIIENKFIYILNMEKLKMLNETEKEITWLLNKRFFESKKDKYLVGFFVNDFKYDEFIKINDLNKLKILYEHIKTNDINKSYHFELSNKTIGNFSFNKKIINNISFDELKNIYDIMLRIYKEANENNMFIIDLHCGNLGYNDLGMVSFDVGVYSKFYVQIEEK